MKKSIYEISQEAYEITSLLEEGELTDDLNKRLQINQLELKEKSLSFAYAIKSIDSDLEAINSEIKRLQALKTAKTNAIGRMKESVLNAMQLYGIEKLSSPTLTLSVRRSEAVEVPDVNLLDSNYVVQKVTFSPDKTGIKKAIKEGQSIDGAYIKENFSLNIR